MRVRKWTAVLLTCLWSIAACTAPQSETVPTAAASPSPAATETAVATETPLSTATTPPTQTPRPTETPLPTDKPVPTMTPTVVVTPDDSLLTGPDIDFGGISFRLPPEVAAALYVQQPEGALIVVGFPLALNGRCPVVGCITVYDAQAYRERIPAGPFVLDLVETAAAGGEMGEDFPTVGAAILLRAHTQNLSFRNGAGVRAILMRGQAGYFANNEALVYDFHGLTADGKYYVNVILPLDAPFLLDTYDPMQNENPEAIPVPELTGDDDDYVLQYGLMYKYNQRVQARLAEAAPAVFTPDLALLDALVMSLLVSPTQE